MHRLPSSIQTLYPELLDQAIQAEAEVVAGDVPPPGSFVSKEVKGRRYWYLQIMEGNRRRQHYLGPDSPALRSWMKDSVDRRTQLRPDTERREQLVRMLLAGGGVGERSEIARVLRLLARSGVFRLGGALVGTQAFSAYANMLGVRFAAVSLRTEDVDLAQDPRIPVALDPQRIPRDILDLLRQANPRFLAVPSLNRKHSSSSFKIRGRSLRVDLLAPGSPGAREPVPIPYLGAVAEPLPFLDYLLDDTQQAVVLDGGGILITVPSPARFAIHKLWVSRQRPATEQTKAAKDLRQAETLFEVLLEDRPADIRAAMAAVDRGRRKEIRSAIGALGGELGIRLETELDA